MAISVVDGFVITNATPVDARLVFTSSGVLFISGTTDPLPATRRYLGMEVYIVPQTCSYTLVSGEPRSGGGINNAVWATGSATSSFSLFSLSSSWAETSSFTKIIDIVQLYTTQSLFSTQSIYSTQSIWSYFSTSSISSSWASQSFWSYFASSSLSSSWSSQSLSASYVSASQIIVDTASIQNFSGTGSLFGTSSWADSASWAPSSDASVSASWASQSLYSIGSIYASSSISSSFSETSSWTISSSYSYRSEQSLYSTNSVHPLVSGTTVSSDRPVVFTNGFGYADLLGDNDNTFVYNPNSKILQVGYITATEITAALAGTAAYASNSDLLDGQHGSFYQNASNLNDGVVPQGRLTGSYFITSSHSITASYYDTSSLINWINSNKQSKIATGSVLPVTSSESFTSSVSNKADLVYQAYNSGSTDPHPILFGPFDDGGVYPQYNNVYAGTAKYRPVSNSIIANLEGTSSWAYNAITASFSHSSSYSSITIVEQLYTTQSLWSTQSLSAVSASWASRSLFVYQDYNSGSTDLHPILFGPFDDGGVYPQYNNVYAGTAKYLPASNSIVANLEGTSSWSNSSSYWDSSSLVLWIDNTKQNKIATGSLLPVTSSHSITASYYDTSSLINWINTNKQNKISTGSFLPITSSESFTSSISDKANLVYQSYNSGSTDPHPILFGPFDDGGVYPQYNNVYAGTAKYLPASNSIVSNLEGTSSWSNSSSYWDSSSLVSWIDNTKQNKIATGSLLPVTSSHAVTASYYDTSSLVSWINANKQNKISTGSVLPITSSESFTSSISDKANLVYQSYNSGSNDPHPILFGPFDDGGVYPQYNNVYAGTAKYFPVSNSIVADLEGTSSWANSASYYDTSSLINWINANKQSKIATGSLLPVTSSHSITASYYNTSSLINWINANKQNKIATGSILPVTSSESFTSSISDKANLVYQSYNSGSTDLHPILFGPFDDGGVYPQYNNVYAGTVKYLPISNSIVANLEGTSSWSNNSSNSDTSSYAWFSISASYAEFAKNSLSSSFSTFSISSSYSFTSSYALTASHISGPFLNAWVQGGNSWGALGILGTLDAYDLSVIVEGGEVVRITSQSRVGIGVYPNVFTLQVNGSAGPASDNSFDLGSPSLRWRNVYAANLVASGSITNAIFAETASYLSASYINITSGSFNYFVGTGSLNGTASFSISSSYSYKSDQALYSTNSVNPLVSGTTVSSDYPVVFTNGFGYADLLGDNDNTFLYNPNSKVLQVGYITATQITAALAGTAAYASNADLLDGQHGSFYQNASNLDSGYILQARLTGSYFITSSHSITASYYDTSSLINWINSNKQSKIATGSLLPVTSSQAVTASYYNTSSLINWINVNKQSKIATGSLLPVTSSQAVTASYYDTSSLINWINANKQSKIATGSLLPVTSSHSITASYYDTSSLIDWINTNKQSKIATGSFLPITSSESFTSSISDKANLVYQAYNSGSTDPHPILFGPFDDGGVYPQYNNVYAGTAKYLPVSNSIVANLTGTSSNSLTSSYLNTDLGGMYFISGSAQATSTSSLASILTSSFTSCFIEYVSNGSPNLRAGRIVSIWSGSTITHAESTTTDIGNTTGLTLNVILSGNSAVFSAENASTTIYQIKAKITSM